MKIEKKRRVVITGLGTVNPTGNTVAESWAAVKAGRCAVGDSATQRARSTGSDARPGEVVQRALCERGYV